MLTTEVVVKLRCEEIGLRLVQARKVLGLSGNALARAASLHHKTVQDIELGIRSPTVETIERLAGALGVSACWLAYGEGMDPFAKT